MKRLFRSSTDRVIRGVCGGLGEYLNIDSTIIRLLWVLSVVFAGFGVLLYIIAAIVIPRERRPSATPPEKRKQQAPPPVSAIFPLLLGVFLILIGISALGHNLDWHYFSWFYIRKLFWIIFPVLFILLGILLILRSTMFESKSEGEPPGPEAEKYARRDESRERKTAEKKADVSAYSKPSSKSDAGKKGEKPRGQKKLYRNMENRMISGVCAGLADYMDIDVSIIRIVWVLLTIMTAGIGGILAYFILVLVIPPK